MFDLDHLIVGGVVGRERENQTKTLKPSKVSRSPPRERILKGTHSLLPPRRSHTPKGHIIAMLLFVAPLQALPALNDTTAHARRATRNDESTLPLAPPRCLGALCLLPLPRHRRARRIAGEKPHYGVSSGFSLRSTLFFSFLVKPTHPHRNSPQQSK